MAPVQVAQLPPVDEMYAALVRRDGAYEGLFIVGVKTTGIFCRPTCPARKPLQGNVEFFAGTRDALLAGYRPCKRCHPMEPTEAPPQWVRGLLDELEADPSRRWRDLDLRDRGLQPERVRRWFQRVHGVTFHGYQRARRLGAALGQIHQGADLTAAAYDAGYESPSAFREAFGKLFGEPPGRARCGTTPVVVTRLRTPLGSMLAAATDSGLCLLEFADRRMLATQLDRLRRLLGAAFSPGTHELLAQTEQELREYFTGSLRSFSVPLVLPGTDFQRAVWAELQTIGYGEVRSYAQQARSIGRPEAVRAVGKANGDNRIAIIIPCHRVVGSDGKLCGYGGQLWRKRALLDWEQGLG